MATSTALPLFLLSLSLAALTSYARPCKTLFFYTTTTSFYPPATGSNAYSDSLNPNPNLDKIVTFEKTYSSSPKFFTFFVTTAKGQEDSRPRVSYISLRRTPFHLYYSNHADSFLGGREENESEEKRSEDSSFPLGIYSSVSTSSIRDRTKDIMSVVGALLFGVGCGALTAATMFLIWSLFSPHRFEFDDSDDDDDEDDDDDTAKGKFGYVTIPDEVDLIKMDIAAQKKNGYVAVPDDVDMIKKGIAAQNKEVA